MARTSCKITFGLYDVAAENDVTYSATDMRFADFSKFGTIKNPPRYATLENDFFLLDGSFEMFPDDPAGMAPFCWSEEMSGADGNFSTPPKLVMQFTQNHSSPGLTLYFANDPPERIAIRWYASNGNIIKQGEYNIAGNQISEMVEDYRRIEIEFIRSPPKRYVKLAGIVFGIILELAGDQIQKAKTTEEISPISTELPINTLSVTLYSQDDAFSPLNPRGIYLYLQQNQPLEVVAEIDGNRYNMGRFYVDEWGDVKDNTLTISAVDCIGVLDKSEFRGRLFDRERLDNVLNEILQGSSFKLSLGAGISDVTLSGYIPVTTRRKALQQVGIASMCVINASRNGEIEVYRPSKIVTKRIPTSRKIIGGEIKLKPIVTGVKVVAFGYKKTETQDNIVNDLMERGKYEIEFSQPYYDLSVSGATLIESGDNYAVIEVAMQGNVSLTGKTYNETKVTHFATEESAPNSSESIAEIGDAAMIDNGCAQDVAHNALSYQKNRIANEFKVLRGDERPGDWVMIDSLRGEKLSGIIEFVETDLTGGLIMSLRIVGTRLDSPNDEYTGEFYTNDSLGVL